MLRALLILTMTIFGTNTYAQSVEERLQECIAQSQRIVRYADAWKASLEVIGERVSPSDFAEIVTSYAYEDLLKGTLESLRSNNDQQEIVNQIEQASNPILLRTELIKGMVEESFSKENRYIKMSEFISGCVNDFKENLQTDGEFLVAENERLKDEVSSQAIELASNMNQIKELKDSLKTSKGQVFRL